MKKWIKQFMEIKTELVSPSYLALTWPSDYAWIDSLSIGKQALIKKSLVHSLMEMKKDSLNHCVSDSDLCPWCIIQRDKYPDYTIEGDENGSSYCWDCSYHALHGKCTERYSTYHHIKSVRGRINSIVVANIDKFEELLDSKEIYMRIAKSRTEIVKQLLKDGYEFCADGSWRCKDKITFNKKMFDSCDNEINEHYIWEPQWLQVKEGE